MFTHNSHISMILDCVQKSTQDRILETLTEEQRDIVAIASIHMQDLPLLTTLLNNYTLNPLVRTFVQKFVDANTTAPVAKTKAVKAKRATVHKTKST